MMRRSVLLTVIIGLAVTQGGVISPNTGCPRRDLSFHEAYTRAIQGNNKSPEGTPRFWIDGERLYETYTPGKTYEFAVDGDDISDISHYYVIATPLGDDCGHGSFEQEPDFFTPRPVPGCDNVLEMKEVENDMDLDFQWTAPDCGCLTLSMIVVTNQGKFYADDDDKIQGPLVFTLCKEDTGDDVMTPLDEDFYGVEENQDPAYVIEEINDMILKEEQSEDDDFIVDDDEVISTEDESSEEEPPRRGHGYGRRGGHRQGHHGGGRRRGGRRGGKGHHGGDRQKGHYHEGHYHEGHYHEGHYHEGHYHGGHYHGSHENSEEHAMHICEKMASSNKTFPGRHQSRGKSILTDEAQQDRRRTWMEYREDMENCCSNSEGEELVVCFKDAHTKKLREKLCGATNEDFKSGEMPQPLKTAQERCCSDDND